MLSATKPDNAHRTRQNSASSTQQSSPTEHTTHRIPRKQPSYNQASLPIGPGSSYSTLSSRDRERSPSHTSLKKLPYDDMKRLLSKPATVSGYTSGGATSASDSEGYSSRQPAFKYRSTSDAAASKHASNWVAPWETEPVGNSNEPTSTARRKTSQPEILVSPKGLGLLSRSPSLVRKLKTDESDGEDMGKGKEKEKKPRNVLRRKPSNSTNRPGSRPTSPSSPPNVSPFFSSPMTTSPSPYNTSLSVPLSATTATLSPLTFSHSQATTLRPPEPRSRGNSPSPSRGASSRSSSRSGHSPIPLKSPLRQGKAGDNSPARSPVLTPAEEVMLAYQRQSERQKAIERSFEEAERKAELKAEEERRKSDERRRQKALRDAEIQKGKDEMRMRRGDSQDASHARLPSRKPSHDPEKVESEVARRPKELPVRKGTREESPPPTPYYTVFGSSSGKVVAVGDPGDSDLEFTWSSNLGQNFASGLGAGLGVGSGGNEKESDRATNEKWERRATVTAGKLKSSKDGFGRSLSRKMSTKFGRREEITSIGTITTETHEVEVRGRPSLQERRKRSLALSPPPGADPSYAGLRLSIDRPPAMRSPKANFSPSVMSPQTVETNLPGPHSASQSSSGPSSGYSPSPSSAGTSGGKIKLWNLMKRISTGGLRDKYHDPSRSCSPSSADSPKPPPVPALPKEFTAAKLSSPHDNAGTANSIGSMETSHSSKSLRTQRSLTNIARPRTASGGPRGAPGVTTAANSSTTSVTGSASVRPSTATRSSSPFSSSEAASSKYFNPPRSARSSTSSYGEEIPPLPPSTTSSTTKPHQAKSQMIQQHIISPSELSQLQLDFEKERDAQDRKARPSVSTMGTLSTFDSPLHGWSTDVSHPFKMVPSEDFTIIRTPAEEKPGFSLPVPPSQRREKDARVHAMSEDLRSSSPSIPQFSTSGAINAWSKKSDSQNRTRSSSMTSSPSPRPSTSPAPPLPTRSPRRPSLAKSPSTAPVPEASRPHTSHFATPSSPAILPPITRPTLDDLIIPGRKSTSALPSRSVSAGTSRPNRATMIFRELPKHSFTEPLTEKQKADKWDALLQKSAQAGGTLHLSGNDTDRLESDELRFSIADDSD
ncbi:hypothetical protein VNI00_006222 [Paramarasmius palmivorus]|uniref:Uncharacterized protein n=1 Tax=Paramarasmius palmivorus TaxID=297713 RepID=A0AAW0D8B5_9AGAR